MKRFVVSVLSISVFFVGLGFLADQVGAKFKSDEKALEIVRRARTALGGDAALAEVRSMVIVGRTVNTFKVGDAERSEPGETEIALQLPDKLSQKIRIGNENGAGAKVVSESHDVVIVTKGGDAQKIRIEGSGNGTFTTSDGKTVVVKERSPANDGVFVGEDGKKVIVRQIEKVEDGTWTGKTDDDKHMLIRAAHPEAHGSAEAHAGMKHNELLRLSLALLLTAPEGIDVNYTFAGESDIDGTAVNVINAEFGGTNYKLFIGKSNNLPVAMSYRGMGMPKVIKFTKSDGPTDGAARGQVTFTKKIDADVESVENLVKFSDYRSTGGIQLPYKWTTSTGGAVREVFDVTSFEINPSNIADKFANQKVLVRTKKADGK